MRAWFLAIGLGILGVAVGLTGDAYLERESGVRAAFLIAGAALLVAAAAVIIRYYLRRQASPKSWSRRKPAP
jgi:drug/metabolite transporter (DMT)-like permease